MGKPVWGIKPNFTYYFETGDQITIPRGLEARLVRWIEKLGEPWEIKKDVVEVARTTHMNFIGTLRDYQVPVVDKCIKAGSGIIKLSTGAGKTITSLEIIRRLGLTATILVPNTVLLKQFSTELKEKFSCEPGIIGDGKKSIGEITVATYQGLLARPELLAKLVSQTSILVADECQLAVSDEWVKVVKAFNPKHIYGLSATPARSADDGRTESIFFHFGEIVAEHQITSLSPTVRLVFPKVPIPMDEYPRMVEDMVESEQRNKLIAGIALGEAMSGRKVLVLTKRIQHYKNIEKFIAPNPLIFYIESSDKERNTLIAKLRNGEQDYMAVFGTTALLGVGLDIPSFDVLILACDLKSEVLTEQSAGRILRLFEGKPDPLIYDFVDNLNPIFYRQAKERIKLYHRKNWTVAE